MKKFIHLFLMATLFSLVACTPEEDDIFGDRASNRIDQALVEYKDILTGAENGWVFEYYPSSSYLYGGYTVLFRFTNEGKVTVASDITGNAEYTDESYYSLHESAGPVLSFDTYNDVFHIFSDPDQSISGVGDYGKGMEGDSEFTIMEASPEKVVLRGRKSGLDMTMVPLEKGKSWDSYLAPRVEVAVNTDILHYLKIYDNEEEVINILKGSGRTLEVTTTNEEGLQMKEPHPYIVTDKGLRFLDTWTFNGQNVTTMTYRPGAEGEDGELVVDNTTLVIRPYYPLNMAFQSNRYYMSFENLGPTGQMYWNQFYNMAQANEMSVSSVILTPAYAGATPMIGLKWTDNVLGGGLWGFTFNFIGENAISIGNLAGYDSNGGVYIQQISFWQLLCYPILECTFTISMPNPDDNPKAPSQLLLTDVSDPDNTILLSATPMPPFPTTK